MDDWRRDSEKSHQSEQEKLFSILTLQSNEDKLSDLIYEYKEEMFGCSRIANPSSPKQMTCDAVPSHEIELRFQQDAQVSFVVKAVSALTAAFRLVQLDHCSESVLAACLRVVHPDLHESKFPLLYFLNLLYIYLVDFLEGMGLYPLRSLSSSTFNSTVSKYFDRLSSLAKSIFSRSNTCSIWIFCNSRIRSFFTMISFCNRFCSSRISQLTQCSSSSEYEKLALSLSVIFWPFVVSREKSATRSNEAVQSVFFFL